MTFKTTDNLGETFKRNTEGLYRGGKIPHFAPEPRTVSMPTPEQLLLAQLMDIHPELGVWALERFSLGYDAVAVRNHLGALMNTLVRD